MTHQIKLQSACGAFSPEFLKKLPEVEAAMIAKGLDPAQFVIAKNRSQVPILPIGWRPDGNPIEYTVFVKGKSFTVTQTSDTGFLAYFYGLCMTPDGKDAAHAGVLQGAAKRSESMLARLGKWLNKPV
jgi:hypothetical protein